MLEAISLIRRSGKQYDLCTTLGNLALIYNLSQKYEKTIMIAEEAINISRHLGIKISEASQLSSLGIAYFSIGDSIKGIACLRQSLYINRQIGHETNICNALCNLAKLLKFDERHYDEASNLLIEAVDLAKKLRIRQTEGFAWFLKGEISLAKRQTFNARTEMLQALAIFSSIFESDHPFLVATATALSDIKLHSV